MTLAAEVSISEGRKRFTNFNFVGSDHLNEIMTLESRAFIGQSRGQPVHIHVSYRDESKIRTTGVLVSPSNFGCTAIASWVPRTKPRAFLSTPPRLDHPARLSNYQIAVDVCK